MDEQESEEEFESQQDTPISPGTGGNTINYIKIGHVDRLHTANKIYTNDDGQNDLRLSDSASEISIESSPGTPKRNIAKKIAHMSRCLAGDLTRGLKRKLQQFYQEATLPCVAWLNKGHDLLMHDYYTQLQLDTSDITIRVEKLFQKTNKHRPKRILIEGQPGYGKTTLATKILHDWATSKDYIKHFKLAFLLPLRELRHRTINDALTTVAQFQCGFEEAGKVREIVNDNVGDTLLVLDGLDELSIKERAQVLRVLYKQVYAEMTVVVTCRTGLFTLENEELNKLFGGVSKKSVFYDKRIRVMGIGIEERKKFLLNFIPQRQADEMIAQLERLTKPVSDMFKSPLFLILLAFIALKDRDLSTLSTKTQLFKSLFNCIIKHSLEKQDERLLGHFDLFAFGSDVGKIRSLVCRFGTCCLEHVINNNMKFQCNALTREIYKLGFLINHKEITHFNETTHYEGFHLSIIEFAAAFAIWADFKNNAMALHSKCLKCIKPLYFKLGKTSLVLTFLAGLLQDEACEFFHQMSSFAHLFSASEDSLWHLLTECQSNGQQQNLVVALRNFIPPITHQWEEVYATFYSSDLYENILRYGIQCGRIVKIYVNNIHPPRLPKDIELPNLWVDVQPNACSNLVYSLTGVKCNKLAFRFASGYGKFNTDNAVALWNYICLWASIPCQSRSLCMDGFVIYNVLYEHIDDNIVKQMEFDTLRVHLSTSVGHKLIETLLQRNQVKTVQILLGSNSPPEDTTQFFKAAAESACLQTLELYCRSRDDISVDLHQLTNGGKKYYKCLMVKSCPLSCIKPLSNKHCINSIIIKNSNQSTVDAIRMIEPQIMRCNASFLSKLPISWGGHKSLKELVVSMDEESNNIQFWRNLLQCKNLVMLEVIFPIHGSNLSLPIEEMTKCFLQLPIERLVLWQVKGEEGVSKKIIKSLADSMPRVNGGKNLKIWKRGSKIQSLKIIDVASLLTGEEVEKVGNLCDLISELLSCLKLNYLKCVNVICGNVSLWHSLMQKNIIDYSVFEVTHLIHGSNSEDPEYYKIWYDNFSIFTYNSFCIKLKMGALNTF